MHLLLIAVIASLFFISTETYSQEINATPLPTQHPLVGSWRIDLREAQCHEIYNVMPDGRALVTSWEAESESVFQIDSAPSDKGFYKWIDKIVKDNSKPDCMGYVMEIGHVATNYIIFHKSGRQFLMCQEEKIESCIGPFVKQ